MAFLTFGFPDSDRAKVLKRLEQALGVQFELHESSYVGEYERFPPSRLRKARSEEFKLRNNYDPDDGEPFLPAFAQYPVLLLISQTSRSEELTEMVTTQLGGFLL